VTGIPRPLRNIPFLMVVMGIDIYKWRISMDFLCLITGGYVNIPEKHHTVDAFKYVVLPYLFVLTIPIIMYA